MPVLYLCLMAFFHVIRIVHHIPYIYLCIREGCFSFLFIPISWKVCDKSGNNQYRTCNPYPSEILSSFSYTFHRTDFFSDVIAAINSSIVWYLKWISTDIALIIALLRFSEISGISSCGGCTLSSIFCWWIHPVSLLQPSCTWLLQAHIYPSMVPVYWQNRTVLQVHNPALIRSTMFR